MTTISQSRLVSLLVYLSIIFFTNLGLGAEDGEKVCLKQLVAIETSFIPQSRDSSIGQMIQTYSPINYYSCYPGRVRNIRVNAFHELHEVEKVVIDAINLMNDSKQFQERVKYSLSGYSNSDLKNYLNSAGSEWEKVEEKRISFYIDFDDVRLYSFRGFYAGKPVNLHIYTKIDSDDSVELLPFYRGEGYLELAEYWQARSNYVSSSSLVSIFSVLVSANPNLISSCDGRYFCILHMPIKSHSEVESSTASKFWKELKNQIALNGEIDEFVDAGSLEWIERDASGSVLGWLMSLEIVALLDVGPINVAYMKPGPLGKYQENGDIPDFNYPLFIYWDSVKNRFLVHSLGKVNSLVNHFQQYQLQ